MNNEAKVSVTESLSEPVRNPLAGVEPVDEHQRAAKFILVLGLLITAVVYIGTLRFDYVYDDKTQIVNNTLITSAENLPRFFKSNVWDFMGGITSYYRPGFMVWLWANRAFFGLNPSLWHASTVLMHLVTTLLVYVLAVRVLRSRYLAAIAATLFGVHPIHVESVAWVSGVTDPLSAAPMLGSFITWLRYREEKRRRWIGLSVLLAGVAVLAKETPVMLPVLVFAWAWLNPDKNEEYDSSFSFAKRFLAAVWGALPFVGVSVFYMLIRRAVLGEMMIPEPRPLLVSMLSIPQACLFYLQHLVWPFGLSVFYDVPWATSVTSPHFIFPSILLVLAGVLIWASVKRTSTTKFFGIWVVVCLLPAIVGIPNFANSEMVHDRYLYVPSIGFALLIPTTIREIRARGLRIFGQPALQVGAVLVLILAFSIGTVREAQYWSTNLVLFARALEVSPRSSGAMNHIARELLVRGQMEDALTMLRKSVEADPTERRTPFIQGLVLYQMGRYEESDEVFTRAIAGDGANANQFLYQGLSRMKLGRYSDAERSLRNALALAPQAAGYNLYLGYALEFQGRYDEACEQYERELVIVPGSTEAKDRLAGLKNREGVQRN